MSAELLKILNNIIDKLPVILPCVVSIVTLGVGYKLGIRQSSINLITNKKLEWHETLGNEIAEFIKNVWTLHFQMTLGNSLIDRDSQWFISDLNKIIFEGNKLILRLNSTEDKILFLLSKHWLIAFCPKKLIMST